MGLYHGLFREFDTPIGLVKMTFNDKKLTLIVSRLALPVRLAIQFALPIGQLVIASLFTAPFGNILFEAIRRTKKS
jgi:hypothetical protein